MTTQLLAWHNEPKLKSAVLARAHEDRQMDRLVQGTYWEHGRGCHIGCLTRVSDNWHDAAHRMFGLDLRVCYWL